MRVADIRGNKILWADEDKNFVDYDFVMELGGSPETRGIPVAFLECFWRRGSRHSKDKARDDSGKLMPMRSTYPTARFLGIVASGAFTGPARELVKSRNINLFYVPKAKVVEAFKALALEMDYDDKAREEAKAAIANAFERQLTEDMKRRAAQKLRELIGETALQSYMSSVEAALSSPPMEFRIVGHRLSKPMVFEAVDDVSRFLSTSTPAFDFDNAGESFSYQVSFSDGAEFEKQLESVDEMNALHRQIARLAEHMTQVLRKSAGA